MNTGSVCVPLPPSRIVPACASTVPLLLKSRLLRLTSLTSMPPVLRKRPAFVTALPPLKMVKSASESRSNVAPEAFSNVALPTKRSAPVPSSVATPRLRIVVLLPMSLDAEPVISTRPSLVSVEPPPVVPPCQA